MNKPVTSTRVPGRGHSSPIVWGDRVFLTTAYGDGRASMLAFERSDGRQQCRAAETFGEGVHETARGAPVRQKNHAVGERERIARRQGAHDGVNERVEKRRRRRD